MKIEVIEPHGMCAGVDSALAVALRHKGAYCLHHLVHNELVVDRLRSLGYSFVDDIDDVPDGETVVFSAHGVSPAIRRRADEKRLVVVDATCPFVERAHRAARGFSERGLPVVVIGDVDHDEVKGLLGEIADRRAPVPGERIGVVSQTTMNADEVLARVEELRREYVVDGVSDICTATKERQDAVRRFDGDALLVLGSGTSANARRLCEVAGCPSFLAGNMNDVAAVAAELARFDRVGVTSGASTPESFFSQAVEFLRAMQGGVAA